MTFAFAVVVTGLAELALQPYGRWVPYAKGGTILSVS